MKAVFSLITLRCLIWPSLPSVSQEELQSSLVTAILQKRGCNQAENEITGTIVFVGKPVHEWWNAQNQSLLKGLPHYGVAGKFKERLILPK